MRGSGMRSGEMPGYVTAEGVMHGMNAHGGAAVALMSSEKGAPVADSDSSELSAHCREMAAIAREEAAAAPHHNPSHHSSSAPADDEPECKQHECCAAAPVHASLTPEATLAWLPEHVISQDTPKSGDCVVDSEGQLLLPFANGPPTSVNV